MKHIVFFGGGTGLADIIPGILKKNIRVTAVVSTFDSGGSTGVLRSAYATAAMGDIRKIISSVSPYGELLECRHCHPVGNMLLASWAHSYGFAKAVELLVEASRCPITVLPISCTSSHIEAKLSNGKKYIGEHHLDTPAIEKKVTDIRLSPPPRLYSGIAHAISSADILFFGPGSFWGSLAPFAHIPALTRILKASSAPLFLSPDFSSALSASAQASYFPFPFHAVYALPKKRVTAQHVYRFIQTSCVL